MQILEVPAGEVIFRKGEQSDKAYVVHEGVVEIYDEVNGNLKRLALISKGNMFGEYGVLDGVTRSASARSLTDSKLHIMPLQ